DTGISNKAMTILNSFVNNIFERIASEAPKLAQCSKEFAISSREIQTSIRLILPCELTRHAIRRVYVLLLCCVSSSSRFPHTKSVTNFSSATTKK
ncbi:histone-fold-containing protein, partial [Mycena leptocephala]